MDNSVQKNGQIKKGVELLIPFINEPWKSFTLTEIKTLTKNKSHHYVFNHLDIFSKSILKKEKKGNMNLYKINETAKNLDYLILAEMTLKEKNKQIPLNIIKKIQNKINSSFYTLLVTGSYAKNKQKKDSDIDVAIIIPCEDKKPFEIALREGELTMPEVHGFVFTEDEFHKMLVNKEFNYGKECVKNHILIEGSQAYYKIVLKGLQNGFKG